MKYKRPQHLSLEGAKFIGSYEGFVSRPYNDPVGHATIGYGHLLHLGNVTAADRKQWGTISKTAALHLLQADAEKASKSVRTKVKARINQAQHDALVSFIFNIGVQGFEDSTLLKQLNTHPGTDNGVIGKPALKEVREQLGRWNKAGGKVLAGLTRRRKAEADLFATGRYS